MTRYIDADALEKNLAKRWEISDDQEFGDKEVWNALKEAPTADVVEVVRCKDCRSGCPEIMNDNGKIEVYYYCNGDCFYHSGNDYCSDGERRK